MATDLGAAWEIARGDLKPGERRDRDRARELRDTGGLTRVRSRRLCHERLRRQEIHVTGSPRLIVERTARDREVVVRQTTRTLCVREQDATVVERQSVAIAVD